MNDDQLEMEDKILSFFGATRKDFEDFIAEQEAQTWDEHEEAVEEAQQQSIDTIEDPSRLDVLTYIVDDVLHKLNAGALEIDSGSELLATVQAVAALNDLVKE